MDGDLQDSPCLLPKMIEIIKTTEYDIVATRRISRKGEPKINLSLQECFIRYPI